MSLVKAILILLSIIFVAPIYAQSSDEELYEMDLMELMNIRVKRISLPDVPHVHSKGEFMVAYHHMRMHMGDNFRGSKELSTSSVLEDYMVTPINMQMDMHMFHFMYAPSDKLTLMLMSQYTSKAMDHEMRNGNTFTTESSGISDLQVAGLYSIYNGKQTRATILLGLNIPTGSIDEKDATPMSSPNEVRLPYPMQIGSGTFDPLLGITFLKVNPYYGWGVEMRELLRTGENSNGYRFGNEFKATSWYSRTFTDNFSASLQLIYTSNGNINGKDEALNPMMVYTADPDLRAGKYLKGGVVLTYHPLNLLKGIRLSGEMKYPFYQKLEGPQLGIQYEYKFALTYVFKK